MKATEFNFDGLVGPTHNYGGLSFGNVASIRNQSQVSHPKESVLQGLRKMKLLMDLGLNQGILPPQERPLFSILRELGFSGNEKEVLAKAAKKAPELIVACSSASSMWTANAATVTPSSDSSDGLVHFTAANLCHKFHRSLESSQTSEILKRIFSGAAFVHHSPLPNSRALEDEGSANHTRLVNNFEGKGLHFFVYGRYALRTTTSARTTKFPARQTFEASSSIARQHGIAENQLVLGRQSAEAIDAGAFHNDVVAVGNESVFLYHENSYSHSKTLMAQLREKFEDLTGSPLMLIEVPASEVTLAEAVSTYIFNSQLVSLPSGKMALIAPAEAKRLEYFEALRLDSDNPIDSIHYLDLKQSMSNGGGPACLRLRVCLTEEERLQTHSGAILTQELYDKLTAWAETNYREKLKLTDLADPSLYEESCRALDELTQLLGLGSLYPFQK